MPWWAAENALAAGGSYGELAHRLSDEKGVIRVTDNIKKFLELAEADSELMGRISKMDQAGIIAEARKLGIDLTDADLAPANNMELSEDELSEAAGGGACGCVAGGGGSQSDGHGDVCACVVVGAGGYYDGSPRCACVMAGGGADNDKYR